MATQQHNEIRAAWDEIAGGYDRFVTPTHMWLANEALHRAGVGPGMRFLDVACGSGALSVPAARRGARVTGADLSPNMIERLTARALAEGLPNLEGRVMDGHALELEDDSFDASGSQFGVMLFPDLPRGLSELARVTRWGGRVVIVAYGRRCPSRWPTRRRSAVGSPEPGSRTCAWRRSPRPWSSSRGARCGIG